MTTQQPDPLVWNIPIVDSKGQPTPQFLRQWQEQRKTNETIPDVSTIAGVSRILDKLGLAQGDVLYRGPVVWTVLAPSTAGFLLTTGGSAANPAWAGISAVLDALGSAAQGDILYRGASGWQLLAPGANGTVLTYNTTTHAPEWDAAAGSSGAPASAADDGTNFFLAIQDGSGQLVLDGSGNPVFVNEVLPANAFPNVIAAAGPVGDAAHTPVLTYDAKGRLLTVTNTAIAIAAGAVSGLAAVATSGSAADLGSGTLPAARLPNPSASTLGGVESIAAVTSKWVNSISTAGVPSLTQPAAGDLSDYATGTWTPTDASGASLSFTSISASYTRIGNLVIASAWFRWPATASGASTLVDGLPFTSRTGNLNYIPTVLNNATGTVNLVFPNPNTTQVFFQNAATAVAVTNAQLSGTAISFVAMYFI